MTAKRITFTSIQPAFLASQTPVNGIMFPDRKPDETFLVFKCHRSISPGNPDGPIVVSLKLLKIKGRMAGVFLEQLKLFVGESLNL